MKPGQRKVVSASAGLMSLLAMSLFLTGCATTEHAGTNGVQRLTQAKPKLIDVVYGHKDGMALIYDVLTPEQPNGAGVIYMVSGGWFSVWRAPEERKAYFSALLDQGFTIFAVHHGSAPRFKVPDAVTDVRSAVRHIKQHSSVYGVDSSRLGLFGGSAGGHLSLILGLNAEARPDVRPHGPRNFKPDYIADPESDASVATIVAYYPPVDLRHRVGANERYPALGFDPADAPAISPILFVSPDDPPTLLIHGSADKVVPLEDSKLLAREFEKVGVEHKLIIIEGGNHGFRNPVHRKQAWDVMVDWFVERLGRR